MAGDLPAHQRQPVLPRQEGLRRPDQHDQDPERERTTAELAAILRQRIANLERMGQSLGYDPPDLAEARAALAELERKGAA